jgi:hypothetical protein
MRKPQRDANEHAIVDALRQCGCLVQHLQQGDGVPDLLVCTPGGRLVLLEVKDGHKQPSRRALTPAQKDWHAQWARAPLFVVDNVVDAINATGDT